MRERIKSYVLILLVLLVVLLSYISLTIGLRDEGQSLLSGLLHDTSNISTMAEEPFSATAAARPDAVVFLKKDGVYRATAYDFDAIIEQVMPLYEEAMGSGRAPKSLSASDFAKLLKAPALLLSYDSPQPFSLLRVWSDAPAEERALTVLTAVLYPRDGGVSVAFRDGEGKCWRMESAASAQELTELCAMRRTTNAELAAFDPAYSALLPEEAVFSTQIIMQEYRAEPIVTSSQGEPPREVLTAFSFNPYIAKIYKDKKGTVYVENHTSLLVTKEGDLVYTASAGGIAYDQPGGEDGAMRTARTCEAVYELLDKVWKCFGADGNLSLHSIDYDKTKNQYTLRFELEVDGVFIDRLDKYWAQAVAVNGYITEVTICPRTLTPGEDVAMTPMRQAAASLTGAPQWRLRVRYLAEKDNVFRPAVCRVR